MQYVTQEITEFTSSNITETVAVWSSATAYTVGQYALFGTYIYKVVAAHTNKTPETNTGIYWVKWLVSNKFAMLDLSAQSKSYVDGGNIVVEFLQNRMTVLTIGNYEAASVLVEILDIDGTTVIWSYTTIDTINADVTDYYTYIYSPYGYELDRAIKISLPLWGYKVRCTFTKSPNATRSACGYLVGGVPVYMGATRVNVNFSFNSFASKETDDFGTLTIVKRAVQDMVDFETLIPNEGVALARRSIRSIYNDIVVFIVDDSDNSIYENMLTLGTIASVSVVLSEMNNTTLTWSVIEAV